MNRKTTSAYPSALAIGCLLVAACHTVASEAVHPRPVEAPAMQGHAAESKLRDADSEAQHRRLFFDDALAETGPPGVSCDHRVARQPDTARGTGSVHIVWRIVDGRVIARFWQPPDSRMTPAQTTERLDLMVLAALGHTNRAGLETAERVFAWCR